MIEEKWEMTHLPRKHGNKRSFMFKCETSWTRTKQQIIKYVPGFLLKTTLQYNHTKPYNCGLWYILYKYSQHKSNDVKKNELANSELSNNKSMWNSWNIAHIKQKKINKYSRTDIEQVAHYLYWWMAVINLDQTFTGK